MPSSYPWMPYRAAAAFEAEAAKTGVSRVARSQGGFMREYEAAGSARRMKVRQVPGRDETWSTRRLNFVKRHMAQYQKNPTRRRWLAMVMWAYRAPAPPR